MSAARALLRELRMKGAVVALEGERVKVGARAGLVSPQLQEALRAARPEVLSFLDTEQRVLSMSLAEFEQRAIAVEAKVAWLKDTLWFVSTTAEADTLVREGVARGRIWTAPELRDLTTIPGLTGTEIENIARLKAGFGAEIVSVGPDVGEGDDA